MKRREQKPGFVSEAEVKMVGPGYDDSHYITVPIKSFYDIEDLGHWGVCHMEPNQESCVFSLEEEDDGTALHYYGPADEFYYILEGEFTLWWGKDAAKSVENAVVLEEIALMAIGTLQITPQQVSISKVLLVLFESIHFLGPEH